MNQEMSLIVLGNTETSAAGQHGSEGKSKTHSDQQKEIMKSDMEYIIDLLNSDHFLNILRSYNLPIDGGCFEYDKEVDIDFLKNAYPIHIALITQAGLPVSKEWLYDTYGIPDPETPEDTLQLYPTIGQKPTTNDPDIEDGQPAPKKSKSTSLRGVARHEAKQPAKQPAAPSANLVTVSPAELSAMLDQKLTAFFGPAL
jgi:phage gp29-like protein